MSLWNPARWQWGMPHGVPEGPIRKFVVTFFPTATTIEKPLFGARSLLRRSLEFRGRLGWTFDRNLGSACTAFQGHKSVLPLHPSASIQAALDLHAGSAHAPGNLLPLHPVERSLPANRVIRRHLAALPNAQHGIQIRSRQQRTMGVPRQLRRTPKAPVPKGQVDVLEIVVRAL